jgi:hypothetical protein
LTSPFAGPAAKFCKIACRLAASGTGIGAGFQLSNDIHHN